MTTARKSAIFVLLTLMYCVSAMAGQKHGFSVIESPLALTRTANDTLYVGWIGVSGASPSNPDSAYIYFDRAPGGGNLSRYRYKVNPLSKLDNTIEPEDGKLGLPKRRRTAFKPADQSGNMGSGTYYCIAAAVKGSDTLYSNEFTVMVDAQTAPKPRGPSGNNITNLTPTFSWDKVPNADVPYYHVILSDEPLPVNLDDINNPQIEGDMSIIWQAITPKTSIVYGEPDPSGTITASPPPLSPGKEYSWLVFNNFGNHPAFSSNKLSLPEPFLKFTVAGTPLNKPKNVSPVNNVTFTPQNNPVIDLKWTNLDVKASTYLVNLFVEADPKDLGFDMTGQTNFNGSILVWETEVSRGDKKQTDTLTAKLDAKNTLTGGSYKWRVFALDSRGAGTAGDSSSFKYEVPSGTLVINTKEVVNSAGNIVANIGVVELRSEVLSGPMEKPLAFYTSTDGYIARTRPEGTYRIQAVKEGYKTETRTVSVSAGQQVTLDIFMERPKAAIYGKVTDAGGMPLNLAKVTAVSEWGDSVSALTNGNGHFTLSCSDADWTVSVEMAGYRSSSPSKVPLKFGDNRQLDVKLERNPIVFSGSVKNTDGAPVMGARVRVFREGTLINELASTPQSGDYSFSLASGVYTLTVEKPGFTTYSREITVSGSITQNITLRPGALVNGAVIGISWPDGVRVDAPVLSAKVKFWETAGTGPKDTITVTGDAVFGNFSIGLESGKQFSYVSGAFGFTDGKIRDLFVQSNTNQFTDTLYSLATVKGVTKNGSGDNIGGVDVVVFDTVNNRVAATGRSANDGSFEVRNIYDGIFSVNAAKAGFYLEGGAREFKVIQGRPQELGGAFLTPYQFKLAAGSTKVKWNITGGGNTFGRNTGYIKVASPYMGALAFGDSLMNAGPGDYIIEAEVRDTTYINLSYHKFNIPEQTVPVAVFNDAFSLPFRHYGKDTLEVLQDTIKISGAGADSAGLFYRSEGSADFSSVKGVRSGNSYSFTFPADARPKDGSDLYYYFQIYTNLNGGDVYGSQKQVYRSFVRPEPKVISRFEIIPGASGGDTLILPSSYGARFSFKAYYGSSFIPLASDDLSRVAGSVKWSLTGKNSADCKLEGSGLNVTVNTGSKASAEVALTAGLNLPSNGQFSLAPGLAGSYRVDFKVSGSALESISVLRTDPKAPEAIISTEEAAFRVVGTDKNGKTVTVSPQWTMEPKEAGAISGDGKFTPRANYVGSVRLFASAGGITAEFNPVNKENKVTQPGLAVSYMLRNRAAADTVSNFKGLKIAFPAGSIDAGEVERFEVSIPDMRNQMKKSSGELRVADSVAFDIVPNGGDAKLNFGRGNDSITVILDIPPHLREDAKKNQNFYVAWWNPKELRWQTTNKNGEKINSRISADGSSVSAAVKHFSEYAVVMRQKGFDATLNISPNPFSPFIRPVKEYGRHYGQDINVPLGTCIKVGIMAPGNRITSLKVHVYNAVGHRVWAVELLNPDVKEHNIWWDGRTTKREELWSENFNERNKNAAMARNGRYFVTVIAKNGDGEIKRLMKPVVLMK